MVRRLVVDAMNVIGSRPDGWWRDRPGAVLRLLGRLQGLAATTGEQVVLVVDAPLTDLPEGTHEGVLLLEATRRGRNAADDRIAELVEADDDPATLMVATSDRELRRRVTARGAQVCGAGELLRRLDEAEREPF